MSRKTVDLTASAINQAIDVRSKLVGQSVVRATEIPIKHHVLTGRASQRLHATGHDHLLHNDRYKRPDELSQYLLSVSCASSDYSIRAHKL